MDKLSNGTLLPAPTTLDEAIKRGLCVGPLCEVVERTKAQIRDFLAQKFQTAFLEVESDLELEHLIKLWTLITNERKPSEPTDKKDS